jgi:hypothetical protein
MRSSTLSVHRIGALRKRPQGAAVDLDDTTSAFMRFESGATGYLATLYCISSITILSVTSTAG